MRFALTGSHGVGKTSVISELDDWLSNKGIKCIYNSSNARKIKKTGMSINDDGDDYVQLIVASSHISHFSENNWFADRSILDCYAYGQYLFKQGKITKDCNYAVSYLLDSFLDYYTKIFYIPIEFKMVNDGVRKEDETFQKEIDDIIHQKLITSGVDYEIITGTIENRCQQIQETIKRLY